MKFFWLDSVFKLARGYDRSQGQKVHCAKPKIKDTSKRRKIKKGK